MIYVALFLWFGFWSAEAGQSLPWSAKWQKGALKIVPELVIGLSIAIIGVWGWGELFNLSALWSIGLFFAFWLVSYLGKQSATWAYLVWEGYPDPSYDRDSTTKPFNDWLAYELGYKLGDEGYSWVWAFTKGLVTTLPVMALGAIFQPLCRELASHARGRLKGEPNTYMEFVGDGLAYTLACVAFVGVVVFLQ